VDTIPGVDENIAITMVAEIGNRTEQFADGPHLASWTAMCPGNHESAGSANRARHEKEIAGCV
jgi:transposase